MGKYAVFVIGPAGSGKSTLCNALGESYVAQNRSVHIANFDPAADELPYQPSLDVRDLISLDDAMESMTLGPNGGLVFCMEYLVSTGQTWLADQLGDYADDFLILDMPGQVEVLSHIPAVPALVNLLRKEGYMVTVLFLLDALSTTADCGKFISGCMFSLSSMVCFDCPFINVLTKCDLLSREFKEVALDHFCSCDFEYLDLSKLAPRWKKMAMTLSQVIDDFNLVSFRPMDLSDSNSLFSLCTLLDDLLQVADDAEVRDREYITEADQAAEEN